MRKERKEEQLKETERIEELGWNALDLPEMIEELRRRIDELEIAVDEKDEAE